MRGSVSEETLEATVETSQVRSNESSRTTKLQIDELTKAIAFVVGALYVTGILAINTYLYSLGIADFSLLEARYVYTGFLALAPILLSTLAPALGMHYFRFIRNFKVDISTPSFDNIFMSFSTSWMMRWIWLLAGILLPFILLLFFTTKDAENIIDAVASALWMYLLCYGAGMFGTMTYAAFLPESEGQRLMETIFPYSRTKNPSTQSKLSVGNAPPNLITAFALALFCVGYFAGYLSEFDDRILTKVPEQFGGAKPHQAQLLFQKEAVDGAGELGIKIPNEKTLSEKLTVLFESESIIVIRLSEGRIIQLSKEMLQAIEIEVSGN
jgi:hypothetical protein